jgi:hypothetical protein
VAHLSLLGFGPLRKMQVEDHGQEERMMNSYVVGMKTSAPTESRALLLVS